MNFDEYQKQAAVTAVYPDRHKTKGLMYTALGVTGEAGEIAEQVKKMVRDDNGNISTKRREAIAGEIGDTLWYLSQLASEIGMSFDLIATSNIKKLAARDSQDKIHGEGSDREKSKVGDSEKPDSLSWMDGAIGFMGITKENVDSLKRFLKDTK